MFARDNLPFVAVATTSMEVLPGAETPLEKKLLSRRGEASVLRGVARQGIYTKAPLKSLDDLKGVKIPDLQPADGAPRGAARREPHLAAGDGIPRLSRRTRCTR